MHVTRILQSEAGRVVVSLLLGLGMASLFRKGCDTLNCLNFRAPDSEEIEKNVYRYGDGCVKYAHRAVPCSEAMVQVKYD